MGIEVRAPEVELHLLPIEKNSVPPPPIPTGANSDNSFDPGKKALAYSTQAVTSDTLKANTNGFYSLLFQVIQPIAVTIRS